WPTASAACSPAGRGRRQSSAVAAAAAASRRAAASCKAWSAARASCSGACIASRRAVARGSGGRSGCGGSGRHAASPSRTTAAARRLGWLRICVRSRWQGPRAILAPMSTNRWRLDGQLALVTGASAGIGLAIARELAALGADLLLVARNEDPLQDACEELEELYPQQSFHGMAADVADDEDRQAILDWAEDHGDGLHVLVNNAGGNVTRPAVDYTEDEWRAIFETNLFSAFELAGYAHPLLARHAASCIVNVGSVSGLTHVRSGVVYGMTKAA